MSEITATEATTETTNLNTEQTTRVAALTAAKSVLLGTPALFGQNPNNRAPGELIELAEYIVGAVEAPESTEAGPFVTMVVNGPFPLTDCPCGWCQVADAEPAEAEKKQTRRERRAAQRAAE